MGRIDHDQTWRKLPDDTMELIEERIVEREEEPLSLEEQLLHEQEEVKRLRAALEEILGKI